MPRRSGIAATAPRAPAGAAPSRRSIRRRRRGDRDPGSSRRSSATTAARLATSLCAGISPSTCIDAPSAAASAGKGIEIDGVRRAAARMLCDGLPGSRPQAPRPTTRSPPRPRRDRAPDAAARRAARRDREIAAPRERRRRAVRARGRRRSRRPLQQTAAADRARAAIAPPATRQASAIAISSGCTIIGAGETASPAKRARMLGDEIEAAVAEAVLLTRDSRAVLRASDAAPRLAAEHEPVARGAQPVAHVVVVAVAEALVEAARLVQRLRAIHRVAGADVIGRRAADGARSAARGRAPIARAAQSAAGSVT